MLEDVISAIREWLSKPGNSKAELARRADVHRNTLLDCDKEGWNPTLDVLRKVEAEVRRADA